MKHSSLRTAIPWFLAIILVTGCLAGVAARREDAARRKARYYYTAGSVAKASGRDAEAFEFFKKSYQTDPSYAEAANAYGTGRLSLPVDTFQSDTELNRSLAMMRQYVDLYPEDVYEAQYYGYVSTQLGEHDEAIRVLERTVALKASATPTLLQLSDAYANKGDLKSAVRALDSYELADGLNPQVTMRKLSYLLADKDTISVLREVTRLVDSDSTNVSYAIMKGNVFDILEKPDSSLYYYKLAERIDPESGSAKLALAGYYQQTGDSVAYDNKMYEVLLSADLDLDMKIELLAQYLQTLITDKHQTERGDYLFSVVSNQYPHEPRLLDLAARYSAAKQDFDDAEEQITYAIDLDPTNATYWGQLMTYQAAAGDPQQSLSTYDRALDHIVPDDDLRMYYAIVAQQAKRYDIAADVYKGFIDSIQPGLPLDTIVQLSDLRRDISADELDRLSRLVASLGDVYHEAGDNNKAYRMYDNALVFDPDNAMAANNYAYFMSEDGGDLDKALELSRRSLSGSGESNPTYLDTFAWIHYLKGNYAIAEEYQAKALEAMKSGKYPSPELYVHYGDIKEKLGKNEEALEYWRKAVEYLEQNEATDEEDYARTLEKIKRMEKLMK